MTVKKKLPEAYTFHCIRCDQDFTNNSERPDQCQHCNSAFWDKMRVMRQRAVVGKAE
ncbi:MAG: hypothetical protein O6840_03570 [Nitrospirae bacterium]|nr:hypothetical protein [Nitrospirota bacterium]